MPYVSPYSTDEEELHRQNDPAGLGSAYATLNGLQQGGSGDAGSGHGTDSGSDFVNFDRYMAANKDVAARSAQQAADSTELQGMRAGAATNDAYKAFVNSAKAGNVGYNGEQITAANQNAPAGAEVINEKGPNGQEGISRDEAARRGQQSYSGPVSMADMPGYEALTGKVQSAADLARGLGSTNGGLAPALDQTLGKSADGGEDFDAGLIGSVGRPRFSKVASQYGGLMDQLHGDVADSGKIAGDYRKTSEANAGRYRGLVDAFDQAQKQSQAQGAQAQDPAANDPAYQRYMNQYMQDHPGSKGGDPRAVPPLTYEQYQALTPEQKKQFQDQFGG